MARFVRIMDRCVNTKHVKVWSVVEQPEGNIWLVQLKLNDDSVIDIPRKFTDLKDAHKWMTTTFDLKWLP